MKIEGRPAVYFQSMTRDELIAYAETYGETALERAMLKSLIAADEPVVKLPMDELPLTGGYNA